MDQRQTLQPLINTVSGNLLPQSNPQKTGKPDASEDRRQSASPAPLATTTKAVVNGKQRRFREQPMVLGSDLYSAKDKDDDGKKLVNISID